jgi:protein-tyrosine-phosphatase/DNA-binding transcriptional ArsR family regulator
VSEAPAILSLVADPVRWDLLSELARSDRRVGELTELVGKPQNLVSYHLGALRSGGLVSSRRSSADGRDVYYRADLLRFRELLAGAGVALHPALTLAPPWEIGAVRGRPRVLFLCTGNSARSQMAEALLVRRSGGAVLARSAGSHPKPLHPLAVEVMAARDIDIADCASKPLSRFARQRFDRVITLCDKVREVCPSLPAALPPVHWSMADPSADDSGRAAFERIADELEDRISLLLAELTDRSRERKRHAG